MSELRRQLEGQRWIDLDGCQIGPEHMDALARFGSSGCTVNAREAYIRTADLAGSTIRPNLHLSRSTFEHGQRFDRVTFDGDLWVAQATFEGEVWLSETRFNGLVSFSGSVFEADAWFTGTHFEHRLGAGNCQFDGDAWFGEASFRDGASFARTVFRRNVWFGSACIDGGLDLTESSIEKEARFSGCQGTGSIDFVSAELPSRLIGGGVAISIRRSSIERPLLLRTQPQQSSVVEMIDCDLLAEVVIGDRKVISRARLAGSTGLENLRFREHQEWPNLNGRKVIADDLSDKRLELGLLENTYRQLRSALEESRSHSAASDFFFGEMESRRRQLDKHHSDWWLLTLYRGISGFGTSIMRPLLSLFCLLSIGAVALQVFGEYLLVDSGESAKLTLSSFFNSLAVLISEATSLADSVGTQFTWPGILLVVALRVGGLILLGLAGLALRSRVKR